MSVWFAIPSARPADQVQAVLAHWYAEGYKIALWREDWEVTCDLRMGSGKPYPGYAKAVNELAEIVLEHDSACDWIVTGGDDTLPDSNYTAKEIADQCSDYFSKVLDGMSTFGVMQPTGDRFAGGCIDRIAGSPWLGREWCLRANGGRGPFWPEFTHMFGDECLKRTAEKLGVYWARPDLIHKHNHFQRASDAIDAKAVSKPIPPHLLKWNTRAHWDEMQAIFKRLEAQDFAPCMPL